MLANWYIGVAGDVNALWFDFFFWGSILIGVASLPFGYFVKLAKKNDALAAKVLLIGGLLSYGFFFVLCFGNTNGLSAFWPIPYLFFGAGPALLSIVLGARLHFALKGDRKKALIILGTGALLVVLFVLFLAFVLHGLGRIDFK